jgi:Ser-tRNA(Ala) deacylase AlaX
MTEALFREDPYRRETAARVLAVDGAGIVLDRSVFYPRGGGQAGDRGALLLHDGAAIAIADTVKGEAEAILEIDGVDLQPCGGTHVANTREIGALRVVKIEKKSARSRRVVLEFASA